MGSLKWLRTETSSGSMETMEKSSWLDSMVQCGAAGSMRKWS